MYNVFTFIDAIPKDGPTFSAARLSVGKEGGVEPRPRIVQNSSTQVVKHLNNKMNIMDK